MIIYKVTKNSLPNEDPLIKIFKGKKETLKNKNTQNILFTIITRKPCVHSIVHVILGNDSL